MSVKVGDGVFFAAWESAAMGTRALVVRRGTVRHVRQGLAEVVVQLAKRTMVHVVLVEQLASSAAGAKELALAARRVKERARGEAEGGDDLGRPDALERRLAGLARLERKGMQ